MRFTDLVGCRLPLQLAPLGGGIGTPALASAVASAGGLGMMSSSGGSLDDLDAAPVGVGFLIPFLSDRAPVEEAAARVRVVEFFFGEPDAELVEIVHGGGALAAWQVGSAEEARAAEAAGCDFVAAQGIEAGGHVRGTTPLRELLPLVLDAVSVPVVGAGGIATAANVRATLDAGADAVRVGTRFVAAPESGAHPEYVLALVEARAGDTVYTEVFSVGWPAPHRVLATAVAAAERSADGDTSSGGEPLPRFAPAPPAKSAGGTIAAMALYAGTGVGAVTRVQRAAEIVAELFPP